MMVRLQGQVQPARWAACQEAASAAAHHGISSSCLAVCMHPSNPAQLLHSGASNKTASDNKGERLANGCSQASPHELPVLLLAQPLLLSHKQVWVLRNTRSSRAAGVCMHACAPVGLNRMCSTRRSPTWQQQRPGSSSSTTTTAPTSWASRLLQGRGAHLAEQLVHLVLQHPLVVQKLLHQRHVKLGQLPACTGTEHSRSEG